MIQLCSHLPVLVSAYFSTLLASSVIAYSLPPPILGTNHSGRFCLCGPALIPVSSQLLSCHIYLLSHCATPLPGLCGLRLLGIHSSCRHHCCISRVDLRQLLRHRSGAAAICICFHCTPIVSVCATCFSLWMCFYVLSTSRLFTPTMGVRLFRSNFLRTSDPFITRNYPHLLLDCSLFRFLISPVYLFPSFDETLQKPAFFSASKSKSPYP